MTEQSGHPSAEPTPPASGMDAASTALLRERIRREVVRFCPPWLRSEIDDIVQMTWMRLEAARKQDDGNRDPGATLIARLAFCATMDERRRLRRRREVALEESGNAASPEREQPSSAAQAAEIRRAIGACLVAMLESRSLAVTLYLQGHGTAAAARLLGWGAVKTENLIYRGLADLRRCLAAKGITP